MFGLFGATNQMLCPNDNLMMEFIILNYFLLHSTSTAADIFFNVNFRYLKSTFVIDLLSCLPWDIIYKVFLFCFRNCIDTSDHLLSRFVKGGPLFLSKCMKVSAIKKIFLCVLCLFFYIFFIIIWVR